MNLTSGRRAAGPRSSPWWRCPTGLASWACRGHACSRCVGVTCRAAAATSATDGPAGCVSAPCCKRRGVTLRIGDARLWGWAVTGGESWCTGPSATYGGARGGRRWLIGLSCRRRRIEGLVCTTDVHRALTTGFSASSPLLQCGGVTGHPPERGQWRQRRRRRWPLRRGARRGGSLHHGCSQAPRSGRWRADNLDGHSPPPFQYRFHCRRLDSRWPHGVGMQAYCVCGSGCTTARCSAMFFIAGGDQEATGGGGRGRGGADGGRMHGLLW